MIRGVFFLNLCKSLKCLVLFFLFRPKAGPSVKTRKKWQKWSCMIPNLPLAWYFTCLMWFPLPTYDCSRNKQSFKRNHDATSIFMLYTLFPSLGGRIWPRWFIIRHWVEAAVKSGALSYRGWMLPYRSDTPVPDTSKTAFIEQLEKII